MKLKFWLPLALLVFLLLPLGVQSASAQQIKTLDYTRWTFSFSEVRVVCTNMNPRYNRGVPGDMYYVNFIAENEPVRWVSNGVSFNPQAFGANILDYQVASYRLRGSSVEFEGYPSFYDVFVESTYVTKFYGTLDGSRITGNFEIIPHSAQGLPPLCDGVIVVGKFEMNYSGSFAPSGWSPGSTGSAGTAGSQAAAAGVAGGLAGLLPYLLARAQRGGGKLPGHMTNDKGQVWFQAPWEQGGPMWIDRAEYDQIMSRLEQGLVWSDRWGWATQDQLNNNERVRAANWARAVRGQGNMMTEVRQQRMLEQMGRIDQLDKNIFSRWIDRLYMLDDDARQGMHRLLDEMIIESGSGLIGDRDAIRQALLEAMEQGNQPQLTYWEHYAQREELMQSPLLTEVAGLGLDVVGTKTTLQELKKDGDPLWDAMKELKKTRGAGKARLKLKNPDMAPSKLDMLSLANSSYDYYSRYSNVMGSGEAVARTATQVGVQYFVTKNPIIGLVDTALSYSTNLVLDQEVSISKGLEVLVNMGYDAATNPFANAGPSAVNFDSPQVQSLIVNNRAAALDQVLSSGTLSPAERDQLMAFREQLRGDAN